MSSFVDMVNIKSPNIVAMTTADGRSEIGFVSGNTLQQKPLKVKATVANIPVATESLQRTSTPPGERIGKIELMCIVMHDKDNKKMY